MRWTGLKKNLSKSSGANDRKCFVDPNNHRLTIKRQAELLVVNRSSVYRKPKPQKWSVQDLWLMRRIDELHCDEPTWGYRTLTNVLRRESGLIINRKRVRRLMRIMGIYTIFPKPNLSKRFHTQYIRPYLLRKVEIVEPDQVWGVDITYIRMQKGFLYLFVIIDWYSRMIVDYELSSTLEKSFVLACLTRALSKRRPKIINSDQGGHFTNPDYIALLEKAGVKISMDGKGQCLDNARTERFFRTLKYDRIYIHEYETPRQIRAMLKAYMNSYNHYRPHSSVGGKPPAEIYFGHTLEKVSA
jgi:putative transposase